MWATDWNQHVGEDRVWRIQLTVPENWRPSVGRAWSLRRREFSGELGLSVDRSKAIIRSLQFRVFRGS